MSKAQVQVQVTADEFDEGAMITLDVGKVVPLSLRYNITEKVRKLLNVWVQHKGYTDNKYTKFVLQVDRRPYQTPESIAYEHAEAIWAILLEVNTQARSYPEIPIRTVTIDL